ncbi:hypothetical protein Phum_PHUM194000 [Pediculus humanus corporis]|uniref:GPI ethanolamine phosphate transferase 1 n=1 Tax=Pediculus humanus subsp. corporis TaxID=121224 RepID=E0VGW6_PEDHC|nr:uncharacterized protein Phum_PHUM194000 [Pediculus humanus corporis]EEB12622.1 hypothetical protein Phum_PHUM194000 [Pediculus humanus corporis]
MKNTIPDEKDLKNSSIKQWMDPLSKRVFLINVNGLTSNFLEYNSTPYIQEKVSQRGLFGIVSTNYYETNEGGLKTLLSGKKGYSSPFYWNRPKGFDSILEYSNCKCLMGDNLPGTKINCYFPEKDPLREFINYSKTLELKFQSNCFYVINFNIDPVLIEDYREKLKKMDDDIREVGEKIDESWENENSVTYIITSSRGSPLGYEGNMNAPLAAWGSGIAYSENVLFVRRTDLTAMLCVLAGVNFPPKLIGVVPLHLLQLNEYYQYEWTLYTIKHFENVLKLVDLTDQNVQSLELLPDQLFTRLNSIVNRIQSETSQKQIKMILWNLILNVLTNFHFLTVASHGGSGVIIKWNYKEIIFLFSSVVFTLIFFNEDLQYKIPSIFFAVLFLKNYTLIFRDQTKIQFNDLALTINVAYAAIFLIKCIGNAHGILVLMSFVIFCSFFRSSWTQFNIFVRLIHVASGIFLSFLPHRRVFGEMPKTWITSTVSLTFLACFWILFKHFKRKIDTHFKLTSLLIIFTFVHVHILYKYYYNPEIQNPFSYYIIILFLISAYTASGTLMERLMKIYLSFLVPIELLSIRVESIYYFLIVVQMFTFLFVEYHDDISSILKYTPSIFSSEPKIYKNYSSFSLRHLMFFTIYTYTSYHGMGHDPKFHPYDYYAISKFFYRYPESISTFLFAYKFFIPFFVPTISFMALSSLKEKNFDSRFVTFIWASDLMASFFLIVLAINKIFSIRLLPVNLIHVIIQQFSVVSVILSYFLGCFLLYPTERKNVETLQTISE